jgi:hypothetical protein
MRLDWRRLPQVREGFGVVRYPLAQFGPSEITVSGLADVSTIADIQRLDDGVRFRPSVGWEGHI